MSALCYFKMVLQVLKRRNAASYRQLMLTMDSNIYCMLQDLDTKELDAGIASIVTWILNGFEGLRENDSDIDIDDDILS
jgi:hypothetical protein